MSVSYDFNQLPHCCGCYEMGYFYDGVVARVVEHSNNWKEALSSVLKYSGGQPVFFNFVKKLRDEDDDDAGWKDAYEAAELRELVRAHPNVNHIGCFRNKNSGNIVDSYCIFTAEDMSDV